MRERFSYLRESATAALVACTRYAHTESNRFDRFWPNYRLYPLRISVSAEFSWCSSFISECRSFTTSQLSADAASPVAST